MFRPVEMSAAGIGHHADQVIWISRAQGDGAIADHGPEKVAVAGPAVAILRPFGGLANNVAQRNALEAEGLGQRHGLDGNRRDSAIGIPIWHVPGKLPVCRMTHGNNRGKFDFRITRLLGQVFKHILKGFARAGRISAVKAVPLPPGPLEPCPSQMMPRD